MGLEDRKNQIRREIERKQKYLDSLDAMPDFNEMAEGSIVALTVTFGTSRPYPMIAYKVDGFWFVTGKSGPAGISSDGLADWLVTQGRKLHAATVVAEFTVEKVPAFDIGQAMADAMTQISELPNRVRGSEWKVKNSERISNYDGRYGYPDGH